MAITYSQLLVSIIGVSFELKCVVEISVVQAVTLTIKQLYISNKMERFNCKGGCSMTHNY